MDYLLIYPAANLVQALTTQMRRNSLWEFLEEPSEAEGVLAVGTEGDSQPVPPPSSLCDLFVSGLDIAALFIPSS